MKAQQENWRTATAPNTCECVEVHGTSNTSARQYVDKYF